MTDRTDDQPLECAAEECDVIHPNAVAWDGTMAGWRCYQHAPPVEFKRAEIIARLEPGAAFLMVISLTEEVSRRHGEAFCNRVKRWIELVKQHTDCDIFPIVFEGGVETQFINVSPVRNITTDAIDAMMAARFCALIELALRRDHR
jgi:hypothetical protein